MTDIVGIDLGTTNSLIGAVIDGHATLIPDASGQELLPSVVGAGPQGELLVGRAARNRRLLDPRGTVSSVKRKMGTSERVRVGDKELSPQEVSALILGALLDRAEAKLGRRPQRAIITVPAYFDDAQRQATRDAGELAGLKVERLVNEPTAAALTYHTGSEELVMVYDLGGGTFDVSVLERDSDLLEVRQSQGDTHLGGDDIDRALTVLILGKLGGDRARVEADPRAMVRLVEAVERAKIALSDRDEVRLFDPFLAGDGASGVHLDTLLTRADVDAVARPLIDKTLACIDAALRDARIAPADIDRVLLVGGSSKMPIVRAMVAKHLGRPVQTDLDADRAVAMGASLLAGRTAGDDVRDVLVDITPHSLVAGAMGPDDPLDLDALTVIARGTVVPTRRVQTVYTAVHNQRQASIPIAQGEESKLDDNTYLGEVMIEPLPDSPAGSPVEVSFRLDISGVLHVSATHLASGTTAEARIADSPYSLTATSRAASIAKLQAMRDVEASEGGAEPGEVASESELALAQAMLARAGRAIEKAGAASSDHLAHVREAAMALKEAVAAKRADVGERTDELADALLDLV